MRARKYSGISVGLMGLVLIAAPVLAEPAAPAQAIKTSVVLTSEFDDLVHGGLNPGLQNINNVDLTADWQGPNGWTAHGYILGNFGGGFSPDRVGDAQVISNIDTVPAWRLFEAYAKHTSDDGHWISSFGLINLNGIFDVQKPAKLMENPSHGIGPDFSQTGPSIFPISSLGAVTTWVIQPDLKWRIGVFDGVAGDPAHPKVFVSIKLPHQDGINYVTELQKDYSHGYVKLDHWGYTSTWNRLDGTGSEKGNSGNFVQATYSVIADKEKTEDGVNAWVRAGTADAAVNKIDRYLGYGVTSPGLLKGDQMGLALAQVHFSHAYQAANIGQGPYETNIELTMTHAVTDRFSLQPDLQYVHRPYGRAATPDATVMSLRFVYNLVGGE